MHFYFTHLGFSAGACFVLLGAAASSHPRQDRGVSGRQAGFDTSVSPPGPMPLSVPSGAESVHDCYYPALHAQPESEPMFEPDEYISALDPKSAEKRNVAIGVKNL